MRIRTAWAMAGAIIGAAGAAMAHEGEESGVAFVAPSDGAHVARTFKVKMTVHGMRVRKAGQAVEGTGHFHIVVDGGCVKQGEVVAKDAAHLHYGKGQTETELTLAPGRHALTLQFADGHHVSYGKDWCQTIHVNVRGED